MSRKKPLKAIDGRTQGAQAVKTAVVNFNSEHFVAVMNQLAANEKLRASLKAAKKDDGKQASRFFNKD